MSELVVYERMQRILEQYKAQRVLCLRAEWGWDSGKIEPTARVWIEREVVDGLEPMMLRWQGQPANGRWMEILSAVGRGGTVHRHVATMPDSALKAAYMAEGVAETMVRSLGHWERHLQRYVAVHWSHESPMSKAIGEESNGLSKQLRIELEAGL